MAYSWMATLLLGWSHCAQPYCPTVVISGLNYMLLLLPWKTDSVLRIRSHKQKSKKKVEKKDYVGGI